MVDYKNVMVGAGNLVFCSLIAVWRWSEKLKRIQRFVIFDTFRRYSCCVRYLLRNYRLGSDNRVPTSDKTNFNNYNYIQI